MRILRFFKRLIHGKEAKPAPQPVESTVREIQRKLMEATRDNGKPRIGA